MAENSFRPRKLFYIPFMRKISALVACLTDSQYSSQGLEDALKASFGETRSMLDWTAAQSFSAKVAVTATTINDTLPCLFTNYNDDATRYADCGYSLEAAGEGTRGALVWEA
jgi:hypothetical protein